jgi:hypothetical protein
VIVREADACRLNEVANHPTIRALAGTEASPPFDLSPVLAVPGNLFLEGDYGGCLFEKVHPGLYQAHPQILPEVSVPRRQQLFEACCSHMFLNSDATELVMRLRPQDPSLNAAKAAGLQPAFVDHRQSGETLTSALAIRIEDWAARTVDMAGRGCWLFRRFTQEAGRLGFVAPQYEADDIPMHYAGIAAAQAFSGQYVKAIRGWNRFVVLTGFKCGEVPPHARLASVVPLAIRVDGIGLAKFGHDDISLVLEKELEPAVNTTGVGR